MKVLQINSVCGVGSTGRIATALHKILLKQGHESFIAYGRDLPKNCSKAIRIGNKYDNYMHVALTRLSDRHGFSSKKATKKFINIINHINPDIIHLHNIHGYYINIELLFNYLKKIDKPVVWTLHDCWAFTGHCSHFDYAGCERWKTGCYSCPEKGNYPASKLLDSSKRNFIDKKKLFTGINNLLLVTPSKWLATKVRESFLNEYPIRIINNGINLNVFKPIKGDFRKLNNIEKKFMILGVAGVWNKRKGIDDLEKISQNLLADEVMVLVGLTENQKANLPENIIGINKTNNVNELAEIYSSADVFVNPTLEDNFPTTNLESLSCGTPVVTYDTGGSAESIDNSCGFIVEKEKFMDLLEKVRIIKKKGKSFYSDNSLNRARNLYSDIDKFQEYINVYNDMLKNKA